MQPAGHPGKLPSSREGEVSPLAGEGRIGGCTFPPQALYSCRRRVLAYLHV